MASPPCEGLHYFLEVDAVSYAKYTCTELLMGSLIWLSQPSTADSGGSGPLGTCSMYVI